MKQLTIKISFRYILSLLMLCLIQTALWAQESGSGASEGGGTSTTTSKTSITTTTESWYTSPWVWVAGAAVFILLLVALFTTISITKVSAQGGQQQDPAVMAQRYKDRVKPQLIEKTKLTDALAEKVLDIQLASRQQMRGLRDLSEDDRKKKVEEIDAELKKQFKAIPLNDDQLKAVNEFFEEMRKNQPQRQGGNGNRNGN